MPDALEQVCTYLRDLPGHSTDVRSDVEPVDGSAGAAEMAAVSPAAAELIREGVFLANTRLMVVEEHLAAIGLLIRDTSMIYSPYPLARSAAEIGALAWWVLEPGIDPVERAGRSVGQRLKSLQQQSLVPIQGAREEARKRLEYVTRRAHEAGVRPIEPLAATDLLRKVYVHGAPPDATGDQLALGEVVHRYHSAFTHGTAYALLERFRDPDALKERLDAATVRAEVMTDPSEEAVVIVSAANPYLAAMDAMMAFTGRPWPQWRSFVTYMLGALRPFLPDAFDP